MKKSSPDGRNALQLKVPAIRHETASRAINIDDLLARDGILTSNSKRSCRLAKLAFGEIALTCSAVKNNEPPVTVTHALISSGASQTAAEIAETLGIKKSTEELAVKLANLVEAGVIVGELGEANQGFRYSLAPMSQAWCQ